MRAFTVDANAIALFQGERISSQIGPGVTAVEKIIDNDHIALDAERLCLQEWIDSAAGKFPFALHDWINDMLATGRIKFYPLAPNDCRKHLLSLGLPKDDHKWVRLAVGSEGKIIVTSDVDFIDPAMKRASKAAKDKIRASGRGKCAKGLSSTYGVEIVDVDAVPAYLA